MLVEISLPKLLVAWALLLVVPGLLLGLAPIVFVEWLNVVTDKLASLVIGLWSLLILASLIALGWFGWRALFRIGREEFLGAELDRRRAELCRLPRSLPAIGRAAIRPQRQRRPTGEAARRLGCHRRDSGVRLALLVLWLVWPHTHLYGSLSEIDILEEGRRGGARQQPSLAITAYLAVAALVWGFADAAMAQPRNLAKFDKAPKQGRDLAHRPSVRHPRRRRALRLPHRERPLRTRAAMTGLKRLLTQLEAIDAKNDSTRSSSPAT